MISSYLWFFDARASAAGTGSNLEKELA